MWAAGRIPREPTTPPSEGHAGAPPTCDVAADFASSRMTAHARDGTHRAGRLMQRAPLLAAGAEGVLTRGAAGARACGPAAAACRPRRSALLPAAAAFCARARAHTCAPGAVWPGVATVHCKNEGFLCEFYNNSKIASRFTSTVSERSQCIRGGALACSPQGGLSPSCGLPAALG